MDDEERNKKFSIKISKALGQQQLQALSQRQAAHLNQALGRLLKRKSVDQISEVEIQGQYELVVYHLSPLAYEVPKRV